ncbi:MAG: segregation/condensation protein A [Gammaproteobacteria bacterium]|nr:segregation/condensation protein A [Pseudomonadota bacterium]MCH9663391.1 segregation/condensation protein A [Gammaproteobacteria bacterium]
MQPQTDLSALGDIDSAGIAALVFGESYPIPADLYIPPEALRIVLQNFSGPLDLLLYLIRKQNINLLDIPIARIAEQYNSYIELMIESNIDLASEYLVMATTLARIKSRLLLPVPPSEDGEEEADPRRELVDRLLEYERFSQAAVALGGQPKVGLDIFEFQCPLDPDTQLVAPLPKVRLEELSRALERALERQKQMRRYSVGVVTIDVHERVFNIYTRLDASHYSLFDDLLEPSEGVIGMVINFFSILCLWNVQAIDLTQSAPGADIYLRRSEQYDSPTRLREALSGNTDLQNL